MKNILSLILAILLAPALCAQVTSTINLTAGGDLYYALTSWERANVTNLTITGKIDASDFLVMRNVMPALAVLDISGTTIETYTGTEGTNFGALKTYLANEVPYCSFFNPSLHHGKLTLTSVLLPESTTTLGDYAFQDCQYLTSINIPSTVTHIGQSTFQLCYGMISIYVPKNVEFIGQQAFAVFGGNMNVDENNNNFSSMDGVLFNKDKSLLIQCPLTKTTYEVPTSVKTIGPESFWACANLGSVIIPNTVTSISYSAFAGSGLISVYLPSSISAISQYAFGFCEKLSSITIPNSVDSIGFGSFSNCNALQTIDLPPSITYIEMLAFADCKNLVSVNLPVSVTTIKGAAFSGCSSLTTINIPSSVHVIEGSTFADCISLPTITIPSSVTTIQARSFYNCSKLMAIHANMEVPVDLSSSNDVFYNVPVATCTLYVPKGSKSLYEVAEKWKDFANIGEDEYAGIASNNSSTVCAFIQNGQLIVKGLLRGKKVVVYSISGVGIYSRTASEDEICINLPNHGIYIVSCGNQNIKVAY